MSRTIRIEESVRIARPPAEVWSAIAVRFAGTGTIGGLEGRPIGAARRGRHGIGVHLRSGLKKDLRKLKTLLEGER